MNPLGLRSCSPFDVPLNFRGWTVLALAKALPNSEKLKWIWIHWIFYLLYRICAISWTTNAIPVHYTSVNLGIATRTYVTHVRGSDASLMPTIYALLLSHARNHPITTIYASLCYKERSHRMYQPKTVIYAACSPCCSWLSCFFMQIYIAL